MSVSCWGSEVLVDGVVVGRIRHSRGFAQLSLKDIDGSKKQCSAAVLWATNLAQEHNLYGELVSVPGAAAWLTGMGFSVAENQRFKPRFADMAAADVLNLPHCGNARLVHNGRVWRRVCNRKKGRPVWGVWPALGVHLELDGRQGRLYIEPTPGVCVNGETLNIRTRLMDQDVVQRNCQRLTYHEDEPGRSALADYYMRFTGMGWDNPGFTRAVKLLTMPEGGPPAV